MSHWSARSAPHGRDLGREIRRGALPHRPLIRRVSIDPPERESSRSFGASTVHILYVEIRRKGPSNLQWIMACGFA
jgi:hypothetical protein